MNEITTVGLDVAKSVLQVHAASADGSAFLKRKLRRSELLAFFAKLPPCLVGMEDCGSAHYWAREIRALGHDVRLMPQRTSSRSSSAARPTRPTPKRSARQ